MAIQPDSTANQTSGVPPLGLASTLREHLIRAGVTRADLHIERATTKKVTFYDLRSTGITWEALPGTDPLKVQQRAGHLLFTTTQGYIRTAEELGASVGAPFPALPLSILAGQGVGQRLVRPHPQKSRTRIKMALERCDPTGN